MKYFFLFTTFLVSFISKGQVAATLTVPKGHKDVVRNCYFTPDDKYLVSTDGDHVLCIWDGDDGRQIFTLRDSLGSFKKVEVDNSTSVIAALSNSGQLYIINFRLLKIAARVDSVTDFSINKSTGTVFFIVQNQLTTSIKKYDSKTSAVQKINIKNIQKATKIITISETSVVLQDDWKGVITANTITGIVRPVADRISIYLTLYDYHPSGNLLCGWEGNSDFSIYNVDIKSNTVTGKILLSKQTRNLYCRYTARQGVVLISKVEDTDDMGSVSLDPPSLYSLKTGKEIKNVGTEFVPDLDEMNINASQRNLVAKSAKSFEYAVYLNYDFLLDTVYGVMGEYGHPETAYRFACANKNKKVAVFSKDLLLPVIYPDGVVKNNEPAGIKKYSSLGIDIYKNADKQTKNRFRFLFADEMSINDSVTLSLPHIWDEQSRMLIGTVYRRNSNFLIDSFHFVYSKIIEPSAGSENLYWTVDSIFYVLDLSDLKIIDSIPMPGMAVDFFARAGENILIHGFINYHYHAYQYNVSERKLVISNSASESSFTRPYQENNYVRTLEGDMISYASVKDYDYVNGVVSSYPFSPGRADTVAVYDSSGENISYQVAVSVPYVEFSSIDSSTTKSRRLSDEIDELPVLQVRYWNNGCYIVMTKQNKLFLYSYINDTVLKRIDCPTNLNISPGSSRLFIQEHNKYLIVSDKERNECFIVDVVAGKVVFHLKGFYNPQVRQPDDLLVLEDAAFGNYYVYNNKNYNYVSSVTPFSKTDYVVTTSSGLFDGTEKAIENLYLLINDKEDKSKPWKTIDLTQLKAKYYIPGLWDKLIAGDSTDLPDVESIKNISLAPEIITDTAYSFTKPYKISLQDKGGGIGAVRIVVNGKEIIADARNGKPVIGKKMTLAVDLLPYKKYFGTDNNTLQVFSSNADSSLTSRGLIVSSSGKPGKQANPKLFVFSIGTSNYKGDEIDLQYSSKDATDITNALKVGSQKLFGADSTVIYSLTSNATDSSLLPSKWNIERTFGEISKKATAKDIFILYLSGHGINTSGDFYYLTKDAYTANASAYTFKEVLKAVAISSNEFTEYLKNVAAQKQLFIIDACASGKLVENLVAHRDIPYSTLKALDRLKDRTGTHIITGCAADAVSYEASRFGQGLLTYSLLEGMKGASLRDNKFLDVAQWFQYARDRVPQLAAGLGGIQTPQVYSPTGNESFDVAELDEEEKKLVPLAEEKPVFIKSSFQEEEKFADILSIGKQMDNNLYETSSVNARSGFVFFPVDEFSNAYQVLGRYKLNNGQITGLVKIIRTSTQEIVSSFSISAADAKAVSLIVLEKIKELK